MKLISYCVKGEMKGGKEKKKGVTNRDWERKENINQNHKLGF